MIRQTLTIAGREDRRDLPMTLPVSGVRLAEDAT